MEVVQKVLVVLLLLVVVEVVKVPVEIVPGGGEGGWREANRDFIS